MSTEMISLTEDDLIELKCAHCEHPLSVPPIILKDGEYYCGRCKVQGTRIRVYEKLASYMYFPCINELCTRLLKWGCVANHELNCPYKLILCPFVNCTEIYTVKTIMDHFDDFHRSYLYSENEISFSRRFRDLRFGDFTIDKRVYAIEYDNMKYLVMVYIDAEEHPRYDSIGKYRFSFGVYCVQGRSKNRKYDVHIEVLWDSGHITNLSIQDQTILEFDDYKQCLHCIQGNCSDKGHDNDQENFLTTQFRKFNNRGDMEATFIIEIVDV